MITLIKDDYSTVKLELDKFYYILCSLESHNYGDYVVAMSYNNNGNFWRLMSTPLSNSLQRGKCYILKIQYKEWNHKIERPIFELIKSWEATRK